jgi:hypothetical protein
VLAIHLVEQPLLFSQQRLATRGVSDLQEQHLGYYTPTSKEEKLFLRGLTSSMQRLVRILLFLGALSLVLGGGVVNMKLDHIPVNAKAHPERIPANMGKYSRDFAHTSHPIQG